MPVGRIILKSISESRKLAALETDGARLLYTWLLPHVDVNGCFSGDPEVINGQVFTRLKKSVKKIEDYLQDMESVGLIIRYPVNGDTFLHIPDFKEKQPNLNPDREGKSTIPLPPKALLRRNSGVTPEELRSNSSLSISKVKLSKDKLNNGRTSPDPLAQDETDKKFEEFWSAYPKEGRHAKKESRVKFGALVKRGEMPDFVKGFHGYLDFLKHQKVKNQFDQRPMYAKTFLGERWREFIDFKFEAPL